MSSERFLGSFENENEEAENINIGEVLNKYLYHWPIFLMGILICALGAFLYLRYTKPLYEVSSTILIKDQKKNGGGGDLLNDLDLFGGSKIVENEIEILQSKVLMRKVVSRLNLNVKYQTEGRVINSDLYEVKPIDFIPLSLDSAYYGHMFKITFPNKSQYVLEDLKTAKVVKGDLNQLQKNYLGTYKIVKTNDFKVGEDFIKIQLIEPKSVADQYLSQLAISLKSKVSSVVELNYKTTNIQRGKDVLNTLMRVYNEDALTDKNKTTQSTMRFIDERLKLITGELTDVEKDVENFKSSQGFTDISNEASLYLDNVKVNDTKLNEINIQIDVIKDIQRYVNSASIDEKLPSTMGINDPILLSQITQMHELQLQKERLLATTGEKNPLLEPLIKQIESTRTGIRANIENIYTSLLTTRTALEKNSSKYEGSIRRIPGQERQFINIKRQQSIKETLYLYLLQKKEEAALSYASTVADSRIIDDAYSTNIPISPKREMIYIVSFVLGLILSIGYIYGKEILNNKITSSSDVSKLTKTPILGEIGFDEGTESIVVQTNSRSAVAEQFRAIRTNMQYLHGRQTSERGRVTLLTSSMSGEGKSFVSSNIAAALAVSGKKTVLLELDLRKPKVSKYLDLSNKIGLSNYLIGKTEVKDIIQPTKVNPNFFVIGSGPIPPNPSELLIQDEIDTLIQYLRENFDEIIIDTPPVGLVTDAQILSRLADVSIYLVRQDVTFKDQIKQLNLLYINNKFPKLNVILNGVQSGAGYGYGYGYGYYSDDIKQSKLTLSLIIKNILKRF